MAPPDSDHKRFRMAWVAASVDVVALEARAAEQRAGGPSSSLGDSEGAEVVLLAQHRLIADERPLPLVAHPDLPLGQQSS